MAERKIEHLLAELKDFGNYGCGTCDDNCKIYWMEKCPNLAAVKEAAELLEKLTDMAAGIEYLHNFQRERSDIVSYVKETHKILLMLKGDDHG